MWESICLTLAATAGNNIGKVLQKKGTVILPPLSFKLKACFSSHVSCDVVVFVVWLPRKTKKIIESWGSFVSMLLLFPFFFLLWVVLVYDNTKNVTELSGIGVFSFWGLKE